MSFDEAKLNMLMQKVVEDIGATFHAPLVLIGEKLGLFKALAAGGPMTSGELAKRTATTERYVREWLNAMASGGYAAYDPDKNSYFLTPEQAVALADETSPAYIPGAFQAATAAIKSESRITESFRTGRGMGWHEHDPELFIGAERFYKPQYLTHLTSSWLPALQGVEDKLKKGARVADIGCGYGASTIIMAQAYPNSTVTGFDYHDQSIYKARERAQAAGMEDRVHFEIAAASDVPGSGYDLVTMFDCFHDMGDPAGVARHVRSLLKDDGTWMIVEPFAADRLQDNFNPVGRLYYCASVLLCTSGALAQEGHMVLGGQAGEAQTRAIVSSAGFTRFRRVAQTPMNLVFEVRP